VDTILRIALAALCGSIIAMLVAGIVLCAIVGYTPAALELPPWGFGIISGSGALVGLMLALLAGKAPMPGWVGPTTKGGLVGALTVLLLTLGVSCAMGGPSLKSSASYRQVGLAYGVPAGLVVGAVVGLVAYRKRCHAGSSAADEPRE
jgi:hypothetical protein